MEEEELSEEEGVREEEELKEEGVREDEELKEASRKELEVSTLRDSTAAFVSLQIQNKRNGADIRSKGPGGCKNVSIIMNVYLDI